MDFKLKHIDKGSKARAGVLKTDHGEIETPIFMPVGTAATVKAVHQHEIKDDIKEAQKFGFQGTPGFIVNGIPVKGAYPAEHFEMIFKELKKQGKLVM